ncbi:MAG: AAA family ATPase [Prolixibacteraceae bacterium]|nr:AAA family ATPase [Prolixibacteraceae bacterium]
MLKKHIKTLLKDNLIFDPTACQVRLIEGLSDYFSSASEDQIFLIKGFAGTGKTTMINAICKSLLSLKINSVLMAPTGRASKVMSGYTGLPAYTIHKTIYRQQSTPDGTGRFVLDRNLHKNTCFIVDEASMISNENNENSVFGSGKLLDDLLEYVFSGYNCRLILTGDTAQLPPVGINLSPALDSKVLKKYGFQVIEYMLTDVVRQAAGSGILDCATQLRARIASQEGSGFLKLDVKNFNDVERVSGEDLSERINICYEQYGIFDTTVVTRSNKRANIFNRGIRSTILFRENEMERGDILMVVKNNYFWSENDPKLDFIANGDIAEVISIYGYEELYGFRFADVCLRFIDYDDTELDCKIFLDTLTIETASFSYEQNKQLFDAVSEDYIEIKNKKSRWQKIRKNSYFNALQVKYAYSVTCHKAQGGQWKAVFVDHGYLVEDMLDREYYRWLYTAFTRSVEKLYLVNFNSAFFE